MNNENHRSAANGFKSKRNKGIAIVGLCVLACKIPIILVLLGFGGLGASSTLFNFSPMAQSIGLVMVVLSLVLGFIYMGYRVYRRVGT